MSASRPQFINPHRLFHGVWLPQWLEERPEVSEKAKKLYAYLTYFAGGKGCAWPSFNHLAEKLHVSRRYVIRLVQELSGHGLVSVTNVNNPLNGHCANYYRFLWHPWMQTAEDSDFYLAVREDEPPFVSEKRDHSTPPPSEHQITTPGELNVTSPGELQITPLVNPSSPKENKKKRIKKRGTETVRKSDNTRAKTQKETASPPPAMLSDTSKIILERRISELRKEIVCASKRGDRDRVERLHSELCQHQKTLGFTPDAPPPKLAQTAPRKEKICSEPTQRQSSRTPQWPSPEEVRVKFNEIRRAAGFQERK